jgi:methionyl-tRNA formyltransferase
MRLVFAGTPDAAVPSLAALLASRHEVAAVLTRPDAPAGRGRRLTPSPVKTRALDAGIEILTPRRPSDPDFLDRLAAIAPDAGAVTAYGGLLPRAALEVPPHGWINLHFSLLPAWRGAAPVEHAILAGDALTGATTFRIVEALDAGPTYGVVTTEIGPRQTAGDLLGRLAVDGAQLLVATLDGTESGELAERPQPGDGVSAAPKLTRDDVRIDWAAPGLRVDRLVRAATPTPGAWTTFRGGRLRLGPVRLISDPPRHDRAVGTSRGGPESGRIGPGPGELAAVTSAQVIVGTGTTPVTLGAVGPEGKHAMPAADWARGARLAAGERFE